MENKTNEVKVVPSVTTTKERIDFLKAENTNLKKVVEENKVEVSDYLGDTLFLLLKIANQTKTDISKSLQETLDEYEKRMPPEIMKKLKHANKLAQGYDNKEK